MGLHGTMEERGTIFLRHGRHCAPVTTGADEDVRATAGQEAGATLVWRYLDSALLRFGWVGLGRPHRSRQVLFFLFFDGPLGVGKDFVGY